MFLYRCFYGRDVDLADWNTERVTEQIDLGCGLVCVKHNFLNRITVSKQENCSLDWKNNTHDLEIVEVFEHQDME